MTDAAATTRRAIDWLAHELTLARRQFQNGLPVVVNFGPGEGTRYVIAFTPLPSTEHTVGDTYSEGEGAAILALPYFDKSAIIAKSGYPTPEYVAGKIRTENRYTVAAVGLVWAALTGPLSDEGRTALTRAWSDYADIFDEWQTLPRLEAV